MKFPFRSRIAGRILGFALTITSFSQADAGQILLNGGFESGFASWTRSDLAGGDGTFSQQSGTLSPVNGDAVPAPPGGSFAAMTDALGPGSHALYQDFVVPAGTVSAELRFDLFLGNRGDDFYSPNPASLDFGAPAFNQQARVDILVGSSNAFSVLPADVLQNVFQSKPGDPLVSGYTTVVVDLSSLFASRGGQTLRLRFAEVDNVAPLQMGIDNVSLTAVPEPASVVLCGTGLLIGFIRSRRYRRSAVGTPVR
ncbi:hypothetical protein GC170_00100 [bacterium]|nr:hypothetical protein [bacterium]